MTTDTLTALQASEYTLYVFHAVQDTDRAARPLVWSGVSQLLQTTTVTWIEQYQAYIAPATALAAAFPVTPGSTVPIATGQTAEVANNSLGTVLSTGSIGAVTIASKQSSQFTCGICVSINGAYAPVSAFPLFGNNTQVITPLQQIVLMFSTSVLANGTIINRNTPAHSVPSRRLILASYAPALLVDVTNASGGMRSVSYDINNGWNWGGTTWGRLVTDLVGALIQPDPA